MLEHPDITAAQLTGYPKPTYMGPALKCDDCGSPIYPGEAFYELDEKVYCEGCIDCAVRERKRYA